MNLYIRADADVKIGTGHIMRCIALAQGWQEQGGVVTFISRCKSEPLKQRIQGEGFNLIPLDRICPDPSDLRNTLFILKNGITDQKKWLVLDGYHFTSDYQKAIRDEGIHLLVIDDMNHLPHYHANIILNQNIHAPDIQYCCDEDTTLLLGTRYVLLRKEFLKYRNFKRQIPEQAKNIFVTLGGADTDNVTFRVVEALKFLDGSDIEVKIVSGPANPNRDALREVLSSLHFKAELIINPNSMPEFMAWADLAISGGGSTCWELAFMGLPSLLVILAINQEALVENLEAQKAAVNIGWYDMPTEAQLCAKINAVIHDNNLRESMSEKASSLVDGRGVTRAKKIMYVRCITLRRVTHDDCNLVWQWSNDKETRQASFNKRPILWEEHIKWFKEKLSGADHMFFIAMNGDKKPIGQIRFAIEGRRATLSFSIAPESRNLGYGSGLLSVAARKLFNETGVDEILAFLKAENSVSYKTFQNAGFKKIEELLLHDIKSHKFILKKTGLT